MEEVKLTFAHHTKACVVELRKRRKILFITAAFR
jgi:hypothetical protein